MNDIVRGTRAVAMVALHADKLPEWRERMQKDLVQDIEQGLTVTAREIAHGEVLRSVLWHRVRAFMATRDLLVLPTVAVPPFPVEQPYPTEINGKPLDSYFQWFYLTYGITLTGLPAISVPCGFTKSGLPVGLQIVGRRRQEAAVLRAAAAFEAAAPWADRIPPVVTALVRWHGTRDGKARLHGAAGHALHQPGGIDPRLRSVSIGAPSPSDRLPSRASAWRAGGPALQNPASVHCSETGQARKEPDFGRWN